MDPDRRPVPYFKKEEPAFELLQKIILWLTSMKYYVHFRSFLRKRLK